jgi:hypothetical protein
MRINFLLSFHHLTLVRPCLWYFTIYAVLSSQNDVGILFFSAYLKSKILHCFHFYFDIIQIKYTSFLTFANDVYLILLYMSRFFSSIMPLLIKRRILFSRIIKKQAHSEKCMITRVLWPFLNII